MKKIIIAAMATLFISGAFAQTAPSKMDDKKMEKKMDDKKMMEEKKMMEDKKMAEYKKMSGNKMMNGKNMTKKKRKQKKIADKPMTDAKM